MSAPKPTVSSAASRPRIGMRLVEAAVAVACDPARVLRIETPRTMPEPVELCRRSGESVFVEHASARYTTLRLLDAEERIVTAARHTTYHPEIDPDLINQAIAGSTRRLSGEQVGMVRAFTRSDRFLLLGLAPAGAGKTTTMRAVVTGVAGRLVGRWWRWRRPRSPPMCSGPSSAPTRTPWRSSTTTNP